MRVRREYRFVLILGLVAMALTSIPYVVGAAMATDERVFGGFVYAIEDCYSYLAKMRQGAEGAWLFHIAYTPEAHPRALFFLFHLLLGKVAAGVDSLLPGGALASRMVLVYHLARWIFGLGLLLTLYRFLAAFTSRRVVRRLAWVMVTFGGGLGWLLVLLGQPEWLGSLPLDFILPEGFTFLVLYAFPHIALGRTLLLCGGLSLLRAWQIELAPVRCTRARPSAINVGRASRPSGPISDQPRSQPIQQAPERPIGWALVTGFLWLAMGLIVPFYVAVAWAVAGASLIVIALRDRRLPWTRVSLACLAGLISTPIVLYSAWRFTSDPVYAAWAAQNQILSPHPLHYLAAYGVPLGLAAFAVRDAWSSKNPTWLALGWVGMAPLLIYLPFNLQRRLVEGVQVPLSLLAAMGLMKIADFEPSSPSLRSKLMIGIMLIILIPTNVLIITGSTMSLRGQPDPIFRDKGELIALDWLSRRVGPSDVVLASYETGNYLPVRVGARAFVGHGPESVHAHRKKAQVARFFNVEDHASTTDNAWRRHLLEEYGVDYVFWGPKEQSLGAFDPNTAAYLQPVYGQGSYSLFEVIE
jgi:hypothetical protein